MSPICEDEDNLLSIATLPLLASKKATNNLSSPESDQLGWLTWAPGWKLTVDLMIDRL